MTSSKMNLINNNTIKPNISISCFFCYLSNSCLGHIFIIFDTSSNHHYIAMVRLLDI